MESKGEALESPSSRVGSGAQLDFRQLVELASDPIIVHDGVAIVYANSAAAALVGAPSPGSLLGRPILEFVAPECRASVIARARELTSHGGAAVGDERVFLRLDGSRVEVETSGIALGDGRTLVHIRDVSRRMRAERAQRSAESRLRAFFDMSGEAIGLSRDGRHVQVNPAHARLFGYSHPDEVIGVPVLDLIAPSEREKVAAFAARRATGEALLAPYLTRGLRRDGTEFELEIRATGFTEDGSVITAAVVRDVTEQCALEERLRESARRYRELFELVPVSLWEMDLGGARAVVDRLRAEGLTDLGSHLSAHPEVVLECMRAVRVLDVNATALASVGARTREELAANLDKVFVPESLDQSREVICQLAEGKPIVRSAGWNGTLSGDRRWMELTAQLVPGHETDWRRLLVATADLTEKFRADKERSGLQERLRQAEKLEAVGRLAGGVAHDFNNLLSGILGYAELTAIELDPASDLHDHQQRIREAALRARDLVRQILAFGRRDRAAKRIVDVPAVVREALALMKAGVPSSATLEERIDPEAGAALIDPTQLHQVVLNLCSNARDAIGTYGRILVGVETVTLQREVPGLPAGRYVRIRVRDDGVGMEDATRAHLFEPFMTTKGSSAGHGLGLAVVHGIVTGAGGAIQVDSATGEGSTFDVYLPWRAYEQVTPPAPPVGHRGNGERILLVDDEPMVLGAHRRLLESLGYAVEIAADGEQALARFRDAPGAFDLVLTDQTMPRLSGLHLARAIKAIRANARVILCTGYSDRVNDETALQEGLSGLLAKPIDRETMAEALQRALGTA